MGVGIERSFHQTPTSLSPHILGLPDMSANDPGFILFGQKMSAPQIPATSSPIPSNSPPQNDWSSSKKSEIGLSSTENTEQQRQNDHPKNEATKTSNTEEFKMMKKPDKIQQCPRCNSMDTKFCYFNNYNVNQPRHFCKSCHRYWTAGGAMRNVPVGAGRRRNRQLSSPYHRHTTTTVSPEGISVPNQNADSPSSHQHFITTLESSPPENNNTSTTVLRFGPEDPVSESASSILTNNASGGGGARGNEVSEIAVQWNRGVSNLMNTSNGVRCYPAAPWVFPAQWFDKIGSPNIPLQYVACWSNGTGISIAPNGCLSSSTSNDPSLEKH